MQPSSWWYWHFFSVDRAIVAARAVLRAAERAHAPVARTRPEGLAVRRRRAGLGVVHAILRIPRVVPTGAPNLAASRLLATSPRARTCMTVAIGVPSQAAVAPPAALLLAGRTPSPRSVTEKGCPLPGRLAPTEEPAGAAVLAARCRVLPLAVGFANGPRAVTEPRTHQRCGASRLRRGRASAPVRIRVALSIRCADRSEMASV